MPTGVYEHKPQQGFQKGITLGKSPLAWKFPIGEKHPHWKGGKTKIYGLRHTQGTKYKKWRKRVFERDNYTCQECGIRGVYLEPHHIKTWSEYPKLRYVVKNGMTLCKKCHTIITRKRKFQ